MTRCHQSRDGYRSDATVREDLGCAGVAHTRTEESADPTRAPRILNERHLRDQVSALVDDSTLVGASAHTPGLKLMANIGPATCRSVAHLGVAVRIEPPVSARGTSTVLMG